jgi:flagellar motility protein MotE (MotC chaperone)
LGVGSAERIDDVFLRHVLRSVVRENIQLRRNPMATVWNVAVGSALALALLAPPAGAQGVETDPKKIHERRRELREDTKEIREDMHRLRQDRQELREDLRGGDKAGVKEDLDKLRADRQELRKDLWERRVQRNA